MKTLEEKNRMIAEFMGIVESSIDGQFYTKKSSEGFGLGELVSLKFHESWDWLMLVVEKIESFEGTHGNNYKFTIQNETSYIDCTNIISSPSVKSKIESTYQVVVEFIEWYNEQK
jgi:hypothetical protein